MDVISKYGLSLNNAILCEEKHLPVYNELVENYPVQYIAGGATQNSIRVAQWMLQRAGATAFIGAVGKDKYAESLRASATADGVAVHYLELENEPTGTCACLIHNKERSLVANLGAASKYNPEHLARPEVAAVWKSAQFYYSSGFFLTSSTPAVMEVARHAHAEGKTFAINLAAPFISMFFFDALSGAIAFADYVFGNESEAKAFAEKAGWGTELTMADIASRIAALPKENAARARTVVITQGADPTVVAIGGSSPSVQTFAVPPMAPEAIVDSNGAGDAFVGGFLSQLVQGKALSACAAAGNYAAQVVLGVSGTVLSGTANFTE